MRNILFYKYVEIKDLDSFRDSHQELCNSLHLKGKVLVANEGINGCVSGTIGNTQKYMDALRKDKRFSDMAFKEGECKKHTFNKMFVRKRKEIITTHWPASLKHSADYVEPKELKKWLDSDEEIILVDARNLYESAIGKFEDAIPAPMMTFKQWPKVVEKLKDHKDKKIVTYCTGGIRCEKASAYLKEQGFENVFQLHGGILNYGKEVGNKHWKGKCFVFDKRVAVDIDPKNSNEPITHCVRCRLPTADYHNCKRVACDKRFLCCSECLKALDNCCSKNCQHIKERDSPTAKSF